MPPEPAEPTHRLQRALASLILDAEPVPEAFDGLREALAVYRDLVRSGLEEPLETLFPVTRALLVQEGAWEDCFGAFLEARCLRSPHHRDIAPSFLGWLAATGWGAERWPWLTELVHFELLETLVERLEDAPVPAGLAPEPGPGARLVHAPGTLVVSYRHQVHRATEASPRPAPEPAHFLAFRDGGGAFQLHELSAASASLLARGAEQPLGTVVAGLGFPEPGQAYAFLEELRRAGAIAGFQVILGDHAGHGHT